MKYVLKTVLAAGVAIILATGGYSNDLKHWYFKRHTDTGQPPSAQQEIDLTQFSAYYLGDVTQKEVYLTFDEGYENGYTEKILDVLLDKGVPAAFFVTKSYIKANPALIARMVAEGHVVGNHTVRHKSSPSLSETEMAAELAGVADYFKEATGQDMPPFFRPPMGEYSERILAVTRDAGYHTIFWSFAHVDWELDNQPPTATTIERVLGNLHNGMIILLHSVSESNQRALPYIIEGIRAQGFTFGTLYDLVN